jgi:ATP-dependent Zn protease
VPEAYLRARIVGMLGGRAAEEIVYGTRTTGAEDDIEQATALARRLVTRWGMSDRVGRVQLAPRDPYLRGASGYAGQNPFSEATAEAIDAEVLKIIGASHDEARRLLSARPQAARSARQRVAVAGDAHQGHDRARRRCPRADGSCPLRSLSGREMF